MKGFVVPLAFLRMPDSHVRGARGLLRNRQCGHAAFALFSLFAPVQTILVRASFKTLSRWALARGFPPETGR